MRNGFDLLSKARNLGYPTIAGPLLIIFHLFNVLLQFIPPLPSITTHPCSVMVQEAINVRRNSTGTFLILSTVVQTQDIIRCIVFPLVTSLLVCIAALLWCPIKEVSI